MIRVVEAKIRLFSKGAAVETRVESLKNISIVKRTSNRESSPLNKWTPNFAVKKPLRDSF